MKSKTKYSGQVVGYVADGKPITKEELIKRVKAASFRVKSGDFVSQKEIEMELRNSGKKR